MAGDGKRRLPLVKEPDAHEEDVERPPWHWSIIGAIAVLIAWLLLGMLSQLILSRFYPWLGDPLAAGGPVRGGLVASGSLSLVVAAFGGGVFVGRFGARAGSPQAAAAGALAVVPPWLLVAIGAPADAIPLLVVVLVVLAAVGAAFAYLGGRLGLRVRTR
jgi:hypothetical protein